MLHLTAALDPASQVPLYEQLYRSIAREISAGALPAGARMPGKRSLAEALSVSVNTVDGAYQMLAAEGYLASRPRSGFYVQEYPARPAPRGQDAPPPALPAAPPAEDPPVRYDLSTSGVDTRLFPARTWARLQKELLYTSPGLLAFVHQWGGHPAVPGADLGAAAKRAAVYLPRPAGPRGPAGRDGAAPGPGRLPGRIPRGALCAGADHRGSGERLSAFASAVYSGQADHSGL